MASPTRWTWVWASSGSWWWTRRPGVLQSTGLQRVGHDWVNWTDKDTYNKAYLKARKAIRDQEVHYIMIKRLILKDSKTILQVCMSNNRVSNYMRKNWYSHKYKWINPLSNWRLKTLLSDRWIELKLNTTTNELDTGYGGHLKINSSSNRRIHILLKSAWNIHQDKQHLGHKTHPNKFNRIKVI